MHIQFGQIRTCYSRLFFQITRCSFPSHCLINVIITIILIMLLTDTTVNKSAENAIREKTSQGWKGSRMQMEFKDSPAI